MRNGSFFLPGVMWAKERGSDLGSSNPETDKEADGGGHVSVPTLGFRV